MPPAWLAWLEPWLSLAKPFLPYFFRPIQAASAPGLRAPRLARLPFSLAKFLPEPGGAPANVASSMAFVMSSQASAFRCWACGATAGAAATGPGAPFGAPTGTGWLDGLIAVPFGARAAA